MYRNISSLGIYNTKWVYTLKTRTPKTSAVIIWKFEQDGFNIRVMHSKDADGIANSVDPDQTAPLGAVRSSLGAVWYGSALFAQAYLSENLGSLR